MTARQFHFVFPGEQEARRFVNLIAWHYRDVALMRDEQIVDVIDGGERDRRSLFLAIAMRIAGMDPVDPGDASP